MVQERRSKLNKSTPESALRSLKAARAEFKGRLDQVTAELGDKLQMLETIEAGLSSGKLPARVAEQRLEQLMRERGRGKPSVMKGGRVGMAVGPAAMHMGGNSSGGQSNATQDLRHSPKLVEAALNRADAHLNNHLVGILSSADIKERTGWSLELGLLVHLKTSIARQLNEMPSDAVLLDSLMAWVSELEATLTDLNEGGLSKTKRLLRFERELIGQLVAAGGDAKRYKAEWAALSKRLENERDPVWRDVTKSATKLFSELYSALTVKWPKAKPNLLDDMLRS